MAKLVSEKEGKKSEKWVLFGGKKERSFLDDWTFYSFTLAWRGNAKSRGKTDEKDGRKESTEKKNRRTKSLDRTERIDGLKRGTEPNTNKWI